MKITQCIIDSINSLLEQTPYFSIHALRESLASQKLSYTPETVKVYLSQLKKEGLVFDAGRGWYSSIAEPFQLDTAPVEKLIG
jgi:biotin operon repressor